MPYERLELRAVGVDSLDLACLHVDEVHLVLLPVKVEGDGVM